MATSLTSLANDKPERRKLSDAEIASDLVLLGGRWSHADNAIRLELKVPMTKQGAVAAFAGALADQIDHHPTIVMTYPHLRLAIDTHDVGGVTAWDTWYAAQLEVWLRANGY